MSNRCVGRRTFLRHVGGLAAAASAYSVMGTNLWPSLVQAQTPKLPELTAVPQSLKGSGELTVVGQGGATQAAQRKAYFEPFERLTGIKVREAEGTLISKVKAMVETRRVEWDLLTESPLNALTLNQTGDYFEKIDYSLVDVENIDKIHRLEIGLDMMAYANVCAYRTDVYKDRAPSNWADFWDVTKFPGPRAMMSGAVSNSPELEFPIMASGVPADKVYPIDIEKAFEGYSKIKPHIVKWWTAGAMPVQMISDKEVTMTTAWNGRIGPLKKAGVPVEICWNQALIKRESWLVPKGAPNKQNAMKLIAFSTLPISQARFSLLISYGFVNNKAAEYLPPEVLAELPTAPAIKEKAVLFNYDWWKDNTAKVMEYWNRWLLA